jgi:hypothetical protein
MHASRRDVGTAPPKSVEEDFDTNLRATILRRETLRQRNSHTGVSSVGLLARGRVPAHRRGQLPVLSLKLRVWTEFAASDQNEEIHVVEETRRKSDPRASRVFGRPFAPSGARSCVIRPKQIARPDSKTRSLEVGGEPHTVLVSSTRTSAIFCESSRFPFRDHCVEVGAADEAEDHAVLLLRGSGLHPGRFMSLAVVSARSIASWR